jgi:hypothetical protein
MWTYTYRYSKEGKQKNVSFDKLNEDYAKFEYDDYMSDMHGSALKFVNRIAQNKTINLTAVFSDEDLHNLVQVSFLIYEAQDLLKLKIHLSTLLHMTENGEKIALFLC